MIDYVLLCKQIVTDKTDVIMLSNGGHGLVPRQFSLTNPGQVGQIMVGRALEYYTTTDALGARVLALTQFLDEIVAALSMYDVTAFRKGLKVARQIGREILDDSYLDLLEIKLTDMLRSGLYKYN